MQIFTDLSNFQCGRKQVVLTIGNFDGVHRGHLAVLRKLKEVAYGKSHTLVITFSNHPLEILKPQTPISLLCSLPHCLKLIEASGINSLVLLPFTKYLAQHSAASFIERLRHFIPFSHLILGHDATLGRDQQGNRTVMKNLSQDWGFDIHYLDEYRFEGQPISSSRIRELLHLGDLEQVELLLGRPYSIYSKIVPGKGQALGFPTINLNMDGLCLPPFGVYAIKVKHQDVLIPGIANLGISPTLRNDNIPLLEIHLFDNDQNFNDESIETIFYQFIRPEQKFEDREALKQQIAGDIAFANQLLK